MNATRQRGCYLISKQLLLELINVSVSIPTLLNWRWAKFILVLLEPERVLKNTLSALLNALRVAMLKTLHTHGWRTEERSEKLQPVDKSWRRVKRCELWLSRNSSDSAQAGQVSVTMTLAAVSNWAGLAPFFFCGFGRQDASAVYWRPLLFTLGTPLKIQSFKRRNENVIPTFFSF